MGVFQKPPWVSQLSSVLGLGALLSMQFLTHCALVEDVLDVVVHARPDVLSFYHLLHLHYPGAIRCTQEQHGWEKI